MQKQFNTGVFIFNIIPFYRPGMSNVFDYAREHLSAASLPSEAQRRKQNTMFLGFENICGNCLSDLDLLYVFATDGDGDYAKINWVEPGNFTAIEVNSPLFTMNQGFTGNGTSSYLNTGWDPASNGSNFTLNEAGFFAHSNVDTGLNSNRYLVGCIDSANQGRVNLIPRSQFGDHIYAINSTVTDAFGASVSAEGFFHVVRTLSNSISLSKNGSLLETVADSTDIRSDDDIYLLALNSNGTPGQFFTGQCSLFGLGASLSGSESSLYTVWNNYFTSL